MRLMLLAMLLSAVLLGGCMHLKGVVVDSATGRALATARLSIGHPAGLATFGTYPVDAAGQFDFTISLADETNIFVYDSAGPPDAAQRLETWELSDHMRIELQRAPLDKSDDLAPLGIRP